MRRRLGLSVPVVFLLAALAVPRAVAHDLGLFPEGGTANLLLVFVPPGIWLAVALRWRLPRPLPALTTVGAAYGVMLAIAHQLMWATAYGGDPPILGGNLEGVLDPGLESVVVRASAFISSLATGTTVGAAVGFMAWSIRRPRRR